MSRSTLCLIGALGLFVSCGEVEPQIRTVSTTSPMLDASLAESFWDLPWPNDSRRVADGRLDLAGFPNPADANLLRTYVDFGGEVLDGFSTVAASYLRFDGAVTLPEWTPEAAELSGQCQGPVRILDVDPDSPRRGTCVPAQWRWVPGNTVDPFLAPDVAIVAPYWGFPLRGDTTYAVYLVDVEGPEGFVQGSAALQELLAGGGGDLAATYRPFADYLAEDALAAGVAGEVDVLEEGEDEPPEGLDLRWIAHATVFTTSDPTAEMQTLSEFVQTAPDLLSWEGDIVEVPEEHEHYQAQYATFEGTYRAPNFQRGELPYADEGGGFEFEGGEPVIQQDELIPFVVGMPRPSYEQPEAGWPVVLHAHGTGGDRWSHLDGGSLRPGLMAADRGFVSIGIPQPFHGDRWPEGGDTAISINSFNFRNPESGRSTFRQGALDTLSLARFVREQFADGGDVAAAYPDLRIDPSRIYFVGHSQGGMTGSLIVPFADGIDGWVLSGAGGGLSIVIMQRVNPLNFQELIFNALGAPEGAQLFDLHPVLALLQTLVDVTDPINYGPRWVRDSERATSVLLTEGIHDEQTPPDTAEALAVSAGLPHADPYRERDVVGLDLRGLRAQDTPYTGNMENADGVAVTGGLAQFDTNHFAIFNTGSAATLWADFLLSFLDEGPPGELGYDP